MIPFYLLVFIPLLIYLFFRGGSAQQRSKRTLRIFFIILFVLLSLRHRSVGRDLQNYSYIFTSYSYQSWNEILKLVEPAYAILNKIILMLTDDFQWLLVVVAFITILPIAKHYIKYSEDPVLTIMLFVTMSTFIMMFSGLRQAIAISLGVIAFEFTSSRKLLPFILIVGLAVLFHTSAFMLFFMYPLFHAKITTKWLWFVVPGMTLVYIYNKQIFGFLVKFLHNTRYGGSDIMPTGAYAMVILLSFFAVYSFLIPDESKLDARTIGLRNFLLLALVLQMFAPLHPLAMRMNYYYIIFIPLLIPKVISYKKECWRHIAVITRYIMIAFFMIYFFINAPRVNSLDVFPYRFFWES